MARTHVARTRKRVSQITGLVLILAATVALVTLTWLGTLSAVRVQHAEAEARVEADVMNQAMVFEQQVQVDLLEVDQTLRLLAHAWEADPAHFRLYPWRSHLVLLNEISPDVFIADERGTVRDGTIPDAVGNDIAGRDYFRALAERIFDDGKMYISQTTMGPLVRQWHMNLARPLHDRNGVFAGVIVAGLRINAVGNFYRMASIGTHGLIAVVGLEQGRVRVAVGPHAVDPGTSIADTPMFEALAASPAATWIGRSALDGVERVHAFRHISGRDLAVVVAVDRAEALRDTRTWAIGAYVFATSITALLVSLAAILIYALRATRRREAALSHDRAVLASANSELALAKARADEKTMQLEATLASMSDGLAVIDGNMRLVEWNPRFPEIASIPAAILRVGLPMEELLRAQALAGVFGPVDIEAEVARRVAALRAGNFAETSERTRPDGRVVELRRNRLPDGGFVTLFTDITAHRESMNAMRQANALAESATKAMSRFVAIVSHEIRTPLNALLNSLGLLADSGMAATQQVLLDMARQSGDALLALINDILEMSRMEAGQLALRPSTFALRPLIESALEMFGAQAAERRIALRISIAPGVPEEFYEDPGRLRQVLINLLSNAVKFAAPGEVRVVAELRQEADGRSLRLAVRDRGPVIPAESRARLFEPFSRLEEGGEPTALGTGLGLTICRHLVTLMGGEIGCSVWTAGGRDAGNEFWLTLPIRPVPHGSHAPASRPQAQPYRILPRTRILLVEDILANQLMTATLLRREGHLVDIAGSGTEAISMASSQPYDLVLMDIFMPGMNGLEATRRLRGLGGPASVVPILALTANICPEDRANCAAAGMNGMLGKPVAPGDLLDAIAQHVWPHRPDRALPDAPAAPPPTPASPVLSALRLGELRASLPAETLAALVEECLAELSDRLPPLLEAVRRQDTKAIVTHAHAMAGMAAEYGMSALEARLRVLMRLDREPPDAVVALVATLEDDVALATAALRETLHIEMV
ncbi:MAG: PAS-domain containing protein [Acetobacteraceae bacterium]